MATGIPKQDAERWCPTHTKGCPPPQQEPMDECPLKEVVKKQVRLNLGDDPSLPMELTTFLEGGTAEEQDNASSPSVPLVMDPPQPPYDSGH